MPIYSYKCKKCGKIFDLLVGVTSEKMEKKCPNCGSRDIEKQVTSFSINSSNSSSGNCPTGTCPLSK